MPACAVVDSIHVGSVAACIGWVCCETARCSIPIRKVALEITVKNDDYWVVQCLKGAIKHDMRRGMPNAIEYSVRRSMCGRLI